MKDRMNEFAAAVSSAIATLGGQGGRAMLTARTLRKGMPFYAALCALAEKFPEALNAHYQRAVRAEQDANMLLDAHLKIISSAPIEVQCHLCPRKDKYIPGEGRACSATIQTERNEEARVNFYVPKLWNFSVDFYEGSTPLTVKAYCPECVACLRRTGSIQ